jgi:hypothetical protein
MTESMARVIAAHKDAGYEAVLVLIAPDGVMRWLVACEVPTHAEPSQAPASEPPGACGRIEERHERAKRLRDLGRRLVPAS